MNINERAGTFIQEYCATMSYDLRESAYQGLSSLLVAVINAAIEEDRASRECCKAELQACLTIAKNIKETHESLNRDHGAHAAFLIEHLIRVRLEKYNND